MSAPPSVAALCIMPHGGLPYQLNELSRARAYAMRVHDNARFRCACCRAQSTVFADAAILVNPYSDLLALVCEKCAALSTT